jgi:hypothetical protein
MATRSALLVALSILSLSCSSKTPTEPAVPSAAAELRATPTSVVVHGVRLTLRTSLWRDFMPISPPDGKPLIVLARVEGADGSPVPAVIEATTISVVFSDSLWTAAAKEEQSRAAAAPAYEVIARDGPKWGPGVHVDVVVRLTDGMRAWLLRAANQPIRGTY